MNREPEDRGTVKTSTILISDRDGTAVYHDLEEVPAELRRKMAESTAGDNSGTVVIADQAGARELLRANVRALIEERLAAPSFWDLMREDTRAVCRFLRVHWLGFALPVAGALALWRFLR